MDTASRKGYPRALPYRSPDEIAAEAERHQEAIQNRMEELATQAMQLRRWSYALALGLAGALVLATTLTVFLVNRPSSAAPAAAAAEPPLADAAKKPASPARPVVAADPAPAPKEPPPPGTTSAAADVMQKDIVLEAMGGLSAANLYQSHLTIGLLADGVESKAFTIEGANTTLKIVANCLTLVDTKLAKLDKSVLDADDEASLRQIKAVTALLRIQTQTLEAYWATGKMEQGEAYQRSRKASWTALSKVLGLEGS